MAIADVAAFAHLSDADVEALGVAAKKKEEMPFIEIFVNRSQPHLAAVITTFGQRNKSLSKVIKRSLYGYSENPFHSKSSDSRLAPGTS